MSDFVGNILDFPANPVIGEKVLSWRWDGVKWVRTKSGLVPVGTIVDWPSARIPNGWLICDGREVSRSAYVLLFVEIGTEWGEGDGSTTFNLPDYRGRSSIGLDVDNGDGYSEVVTLDVSGIDATILGYVGGSQYVQYHDHNLQDPGHQHPYTDPGHQHPYTDPGHEHPYIDPGHEHGVTDPSHAHSISDPGHAHVVPSHAHPAAQNDHAHYTGAHGHGDPGHAHYTGSHGHGDPGHSHTVDGLGFTGYLGMAAGPNSYATHSGTAVGTTHVGTGIQGADAGWSDTRASNIAAADAGWSGGSSDNTVWTGGNGDFGSYGSGTGIGIYGNYTGISIQASYSGIAIESSDTGITIDGNTTGITIDGSVTGITIDDYGLGFSQNMAPTVVVPKIIYAGTDL